MVDVKRTDTMTGAAAKDVGQIDVSRDIGQIDVSRSR